MSKPPSRFEKVKGPKAASQLFTLGKKGSNSSIAQAAAADAPVPTPRTVIKRSHPASEASNSPTTSPAGKKKRVDPRLAKQNATKQASAGTTQPTTSTTLFGKGSAFSVVGSSKNRSASAGTSVDVMGGGKVGAFTTATSNFSVASLSSLLSEGVFFVDLLSWKNQCLDIQFSAAEFSNLVEEAKMSEAEDQLAKVVCCALKAFLSENVAVPMNPTFAATIRNVFTSEKDLSSKLMVQSALYSALHTMGTSTEREKMTERIGLILGLLETVMSNLEEWPLALVSLAVADSLDRRGWVDHPHAANLVPKIFSAFDTIFPTDEMTKDVGAPTLGKRQTGALSESKFKKDTKEINCMKVKLVDLLEKCLQKESAQREGLAKNAIRTMSACCGIGEFRIFATKRLDNWLQNAKLQRCAIELFLFLASNVGSEGSDGYKPVMKFLAHMKSMQSKQINHVYNVVIKEIAKNDEQSIGVLVGLLVESEFSDNKSGYGMGVLPTLNSFNPKITRQVLAEKLVKMKDKDETFRLQKNFIRELVRTHLRSDFSFSAMAKDLYAAVSKKVGDELIPEKLFNAVIDTVCSMPFLSLTNQIRKAFAVRRSGPTLTMTQSDHEAVTRMQAQLLELFTVSFEWLKSVKVENARNIHHLAFYKVLYFSQYSDYHVPSENWPTEQDLTYMQKMASEVQFSEDLFNSLFEIGLDPEQPMDSGYILDLISKMTMRTLNSTNCGLGQKETSSITINSFHCVEKLFQLTSFRGDPQRPIDSDDENLLSVKDNYWKAWLILLVWCCMNKTSILPAAYEKYPILKLVIQVSVTRDYTFPPPAFGHNSTAEKIREEEEKLAAEEKSAILEVESRMVKATIGLNNSRLATRLCLNNPEGPMRAPTDDFFNELRSVNEINYLGAQLCQCRTPDILLDLIRDQGTQRAMPSITRIVSSTGQAIHHLPLLCLAQIALFCIDNSGYHAASEGLTEENLDSIIFKLRHYLRDSKSTIERVKELLYYVVDQLGATTKAQRQAAVKLFERMLNNNFGILEKLSEVVFFAKMKQDICTSLATKACTVESDPEYLAEYVAFIKEHIAVQAWHEVSVRLSFLVDRCMSSEAVNGALLHFYTDYLSAAASSESKIDWIFDDDLQTERVCVKLPDATVTITSHSLSALIKLLCFAKTDSDSDAQETREKLLGVWFPSDPKKQPTVQKFTDSGDLVDLELLSVDLKKKMLCSNDDRLSKIALNGVGAKEALTYIRTFGLSSNSAMQLLSIIEKGSNSLTDLKQVKNALSFIESYSKDGIAPAKFTKKMTALSKVKAEEDITDSPIVITVTDLKNDVISDVAIEEKPTVFTKETVEEVLDEICKEDITDSNQDQKTASSPKWSKLNVAISSNTSLASITLAIVEKNLDAFLAHAQVELLVLLISMMNCADKNTSLTSSLTTLAEKLEKNQNVPSFVMSTLRKYVVKPAKPQFLRRAVPDLEGKTCIALATLDADATLRKLVDIGGTGQSMAAIRLNDFEVNRLINHYLLLCPEIIEGPEPQDSPKANSTLITKIRQMFASNSNAVYRLILQIPHRAPPTTLEFLFSTLLSSLDDRLNPVFVLDFVTACVDEIRYLPTNDQTVVFVQYIIHDIVRFTGPSKDTAIANRLSIVVAILDVIIAESRNSSTLVRLLFDYFEKFLYAPPQTAEDERKGDAVKAITSSLATVYPSFSVFIHNSSSEIAKQKDQIGIGERMVARDIYLHHTMVSLFGELERSELTEARKTMDNLLELAHLQPKVFVRQLPALIAKLHTVAQLPMGVKRMKETGYYDVLMFVLEAVIATEPYSFESEENMTSLFTFFFEYFKNKVAKTKSAFFEFVKLIMDVVLVYIEKYKDARKFFAERLTYLVEMNHYVKHEGFLRILECLPRTSELDDVVEKQNITQHHPAVHHPKDRDLRELQRDDPREPRESRDPRGRGFHRRGTM
ncbi:hypothetical protein L596_021173 [Steinernema carpocapsae]|uniref:Uncharacterized protein n=1 Tax=Steinernema carpocapsae TaxID=34508 RepID=A0A4U5MVY2_STECR|nr:hypothetical protein L596_021173 [Steinernema carpocapsae]